MTNNFKLDIVVYTDTHAVHKDTNISLSRLKGIVVDNKDNYNILVNIDNIGIVGFSYFELSLVPIVRYVNED